MTSSVSFSGAYAASKKNDSEQLSALSYEVAYLHETTGADIKAAEGYIHILANYSDTLPNFAKAFSRLQRLCRKYTEKYNEKSRDPMTAYNAKKESDMFFARMKNVYDYYNMKGEYRKAVSILNALIRIEEKSMYLLDRGNIFLYGLNNPTKALDDFEFVMEMDPNHPTVYTNIGIANEYLGNFDKAKIAYNKAAKIAPQNHWVHYGLSRARGINLANSSQIIKDWYFIGPFDSSGKPLPVEKQITEELDIDKEYTLENEQKVFWFRPFEIDDFGFVNLSNIFMKKDFVRAYALTWVYSPKNRQVLFRVGSDDGVTLWVNGNIMMDNLESQPARVDDDIVRVRLRKGWNSVLLRVTQFWGGWGFYFRITDPRGKIVDDLIFDPERDDARAKELIEGVEKRRFYNTVKWVVIYSIILVVTLLIGFILTINIINTVKTRKLREDFVSSITHDLKIPIAAIMAATETLVDGRSKDEKRRSRYYGIIDEEAKRLNVYVSKILEFSRNPKIKKHYLLKERNIVSVVEKAINIYKKDGLVDDLNISLDAKENIPLVALDEEAFVQVMVNLISNADKYSLEDKKIEITISSPGDMVEVRVKDHGMGLKPEDAKSMFKDFFRSDSVIEKNIPGAGLGLTFVKRIVEVHKGTISVESALGKGSVFIVQLPAI
jgi:signal transduction histidine kinase/tetratricopeptide (TPR) repeat protein